LAKTYRTTLVVRVVDASEHGERVVGGQPTRAVRLEAVVAVDVDVLDVDRAEGEVVRAQVVVVVGVGDREERLGVTRVVEAREHEEARRSLVLRHRGNTHSKDGHAGQAERRKELRDHG
jgi:hypothetical protein